VLLTSHGGRQGRSTMKLRRDLAGLAARRFRLSALDRGAYPQGHDQIISHRHCRHDGYAAGDDEDLSQPEA